MYHHCPFFRNLLDNSGNSTAGYATFPLTAAQSSSVGVCVNGFQGSVNRTCVKPYGLPVQWGNISGVCTPMPCLSFSYLGFSWPQTTPLPYGNKQVTLNCSSRGYGNGTATMNCLFGQTWDISSFNSMCIEPACFPISPDSTTGVASFPQSSSNTRINGTCPPGNNGNKMNKIISLN